jgi:hypothetical protein
MIQRIIVVAFAARKSTSAPRSLVIITALFCQNLFCSILLSVKRGLHTITNICSMMLSQVGHFDRGAWLFWEHVLTQTLEENPVCLIMWDFDSCQATVDAFNAAIDNGEEPPEWLNVARVTGSITVPSFQTAIFSCAADCRKGGGIAGNSMIAPNTFAQHNRIDQTFNNVGFTPFFMAHAVCPIGRNYALRDHRKKTTAVTEPICRLWCPPYCVVTCDSHTGNLGRMNCIDAKFRVNNSSLISACPI